MRDRLAGLQGALAQRAAPLAVATFLPLLILVISMLPAYEAARERALDSLISVVRSNGRDSPVLVVDIDRRSIDQQGAWPWSREQIATLVAGIAAAGPKVIGLDILIETRDQQSPAALARRLAAGPVPDELRQRLDTAARTLTDGDLQLRSVLERVPVIMGAAVSPDEERRPARAPTPMLMQSRPYIPDLWRAAGIVGPHADLANAAAGLGVLAALGDSDGRVRQVPLLVAAAGALWPGIALDVVRASKEATAVIVTPQGHLRVGDTLLRLPRDALLRLDPVDDATAVRDTVSAADVIIGKSIDRLQGRIVLVGSSSPELGGLRTAGFGALQPSVQLQAAAVRQLLAQRVPVRPPWLAALELCSVLAAGLVALLLAMRWPPLRAGAIVASAAGAWITASATLAFAGNLLLDPIGVPLGATGSFALAALVTASATRRRAEALRRRFEQHLAPELVRRLSDTPGLLKLSGEEREVTILFTDIEGFTSMTERAEPAALIRALDRYLEGMTAIVVAHGGMVEKIVGDGLHGLFNAPLDLAEHAQKGIACACALHTFAEGYRREPEAAAIGFGRTRIGIATGSVILGDVGGGSKVDYTAYGNAMNLAARLEAANKELGTTICIGGSTALQAGGTAALRPLGDIAIRGQAKPVAIFEPWPEDIGGSERQTYLDAVDRLGTERETAISKLSILASLRPNDTALRHFITRLKAGV